MDAQDREWKERFAARPRGGAAGDCPRAETLSAWGKGTLPEDAVAHLSACTSCREEWIGLRRLLAENSPTDAPRNALRSRLYALLPPRRIPYGWIAATAIVLVAIGAALLSRGGEPAPAPRPVVVQPPAPAPRPPAPEVRPAPVDVVPKNPPPTVAKPEERVVVPPSPPAPVLPPVKDQPVAKPAPQPETPTPAPVPEKPPTVTRAKLRGSLLAVAGGVSTQTDTDAWQPLRVAQSRDFTGAVKVKADVAANKVRVGTHTCYLQRGAELALTLEEGRTLVRLARGEALFDVTPGRDLFEVETPNGLVTVKGTRFLVALDRNETEVVVQRGAVQFNAVALAAGERSTGGPPQKVDLTKRLVWVRALEETIRIEADQMALAGGMTVLPDPTASGGRAVGLKDPPKAGQEAVAEIAAKRKQPATYAVWIRLHWAHGVPPALTLTVGDALTWSSKHVTAQPAWQWVRAGGVELADGAFRVRLADTQPGMRVDQIILTSDPEYNPQGESK